MAKERKPRRKFYFRIYRVGEGALLSREEEDLEFDTAKLARATLIERLRVGKIEPGNFEIHRVQDELVATVTSRPYVSLTPSSS